MKLPILARSVIDTRDDGFNGSIAPWQDGFLYVYRVGGRPHGNAIGQRCCLLDRGFSPRSQPFEFSSGRELDPRLVQVGDSYRVFSSYHPRPGDGAPGPPNPLMRTVRAQDGVPRLSEPVRLENVGFPLRPVEKNWIPFLFEDRLHLVYQVEPHVVLEVDANGRCRRAHESRRDLGWKWGALSGGTPAVRIETGTGDEEYLTFFHSFLSADPASYRAPRRYFAGAYAFRARPPFEITRATCEPLTWEGLGEARPIPFLHRVVFPSGLVREGDRLLLVYGEHDAFSFAVELSLDAILSLLR